MPKSVYIASTGRDSGKSIIVFGMMEYLLGRSHRIGYFKPIATDSTTGRDTMSLVSEHWKQAMAGRVVSAFTQEEADEKLSELESRITDRVNGVDHRDEAADN